MTEQEVCIGNLAQQKVYLNWSNVKDICTNAVSEAYEQARKENKKLCKKIDELYENIDMWAAENARFRELLEECQGSIATLLSKKITEVNGIKQEELLAKISEALGEE